MVSYEEGHAPPITIHRNGVSHVATIEPEPEDAPAVDLIAYLVLLKRRWWLLIVVPLLLACAAYALVSRRQPSYTATTTLLINPVVGSNGNPADDITAASLLTKTYGAFVTSPVVLQRVVTALKLPDSPTQLESRVTSAADPSAQVIRITTKYGTAQGAADISNAVGDQFIAYLGDMPKAPATQGTVTLRDSINRARSDRDNVAAQLATLRSSVGTPSAEDNTRIANLESLLQQYQNTYNSLLDLQQRLNLTQLSSQNGVNVAVRATPPAHPAGSLKLLATAAALLFGFGGTIVGTVVMEQARPRVRSRKDIARVADLPVLATVPHAAKESDLAVLVNARSATSEAIFALQTRVWIEGRHTGSTTIAITSAGADEGGSEVAANLATAFAQAGHRVILVDGKLRAPTLWQLYNKDEKHPGLAELAAVPSLAPRDVLTPGPVPNLHLLLAGPVSIVPTERLTSERSERILDSLRGRADLIIIDAPPPLADANTLLFAVDADHTIVVARAGRTRAEALRATIASVRAVKARVLGIVLYDMDRDGSPG